MFGGLEIEMQKVQISVDHFWFSRFYCTDLVHFYLCHEKK